MLYGYARVSSVDQNMERQLVAIEKVGVLRENIFQDYRSGKDFNRPSYQKMIATVQPGDIIVIKSIDRLGRDYEEIKLQWHHLTRDLKVDMKVIDMPALDTTVVQGNELMKTFMSDIILQVLSFNAEQERKFIKERQAEGIALAKKRGVQFGRPKKALPENFDELFKRYLAGETIKSLSQECNLSETTLRSRLIDRKKEEMAKTS